MNINKKYKLEEVTSKDQTRQVLNSVYAYQNGRSWAVATEGKALAKVPITLEDGELSRGNSIKASDLKFQRQNPELKKKEELFAFLQPLDGQYPNFDQLFTTEEPTVTFGIDVSLLLSLSKALGTDKLKVEVINGDKAMRVYSLTDEAHGLIMPIQLPKEKVKTSADVAETV